MLDALQAIGLLGLIACQFILIRGCFKINDTLPIQGGNITAKIDRTADLLDEVAQLIADFSDNIGVKPDAHPPPSPMEAILSSLISRTTMASNHATQKQEWEVLPPDDDTTPTSEAESQPHEHRG